MVRSPRRRSHTLAWTVALALVVGVAAYARDEATAPSPPSSGGRGVEADGAAATLPAGDDSVVSAHVDGDTLKVANGETIRIIGVDTPETRHPSTAVECLGPEASAYTAEAFPIGTEVRLVYDVERFDRYGRTLAYVYRRADGLFLNLALVRDGYAQVATYPPNIAHVDTFVAAQVRAREAQQGLWGPTCADAASTAPAGVSPTDEESQFRNCAEARKWGAAPVHRSDPGYGPHLDRDGDGIGCE